MKSALKRYAGRIVFIAPFAGFLFSPTAALADLLGSATNFAVLGGSTITNTGTTVINGNIGVFAGSSYTGAASVVQTG